MIKYFTAIRKIPEQFDTKQWIDSVSPSSVPIEKGHLFNLGGRIVEVIAIYKGKSRAVGSKGRTTFYRRQLGLWRNVVSYRRGNNSSNLSE
jgi:hypothetical protein